MPLIEKLSERGILAIGTVKANRMKGAEKNLMSDKRLKKEGRGSYDWTADTAKNITLFKWCDSNTVNLASNYIGKGEGEMVKRWNAREKKHEFYVCPKMIHEYNKFMGGVDLATCYSHYIGFN